MGILSVLLYDPLLAPALLFAAASWRKLSYAVRAHLVACAAGLVFHLLLYARTVHFGDDAAWGPRYHVTGVQLLLLLLLALAWTRVRRGVFLPLLAAAFVTQLAGVALPAQREIEQEAAGTDSHFRIGQRLLNIEAGLRGAPPSGAPLLGERATLGEGAAVSYLTTWRLLPFNVEKGSHSNPPFRAFVRPLKAAWVLLALLALGLTGWLVSRDFALNSAQIKPTRNSSQASDLEHRPPLSE